MPSSHVSPQQSANDSEPLASASQSSTSVSALPKRMTCQPPWYYRRIISLIKPLYRLQVWQRSHKRDNYQQEVAQRFGKHYPPPPAHNFSASNVSNTHEFNVKNNTIWCHAVSLGETNTVAPLLDALLAQGYQIWLTNTTQTGYARGASRFADDITQGRLSHSYVPVDTPAVIATFLAHVQPVAALFVETELWANILAKLSEQGVPSILVNGRLSAASFTRYQKIAGVSRSMMQNLTLIIAQDSDSAKRFRQLGAYSSQIRIAGSLKWVINTPKISRLDAQNGLNQMPANQTPDSQLPNSEQKSAVDTPSDAKFERLNRPVWVAASTHSGEESVALALQQQLLSIPALADTLLIIVPRHPERFAEVAALIQQSGLLMARRSADETISTQTQVYLADSMGELMQWYTLADVALVGGSLVDVGGHNPVEPATVATPILMGRYTQSCQTVVDKLAAAGALYQPHNKFYQAISASNQPTADSRLENNSLESNGLEHDKLQQKPSSQPSSDMTLDTTLKTDDSALIYQQLQFWLSHSQVAKQAGQAGAQLAAEQQSVLARQLAMIENTIHKFGTELA